MEMENLEPKFLWKHFAELCRIPRGSKNETAVVAHVEAEARKRGVEVQRDQVGDLVLRIPATAGHESPIRLNPAGSGDRRAARSTAPARTNHAAALTAACRCHGRSRLNVPAKASSA